MNGVKTVHVHAVMLDKLHVGTQGAAENWLVANEFKAEGFVDNDQMWIYEQRPRSDFQMNAFGEGKDFRVVTIAQGVGATVGLLADGVKRTHAVTENADARQSFLFTKVDDAKRLVTGPVLVPNTVDLQGDFEFEEDIAKTAHGFMADARNIGQMHNKFGGIGTPVESWLLRDDWFVPIQDGYKIYPRGTWMLTVHVDDDKAWKKVLDGELRGFSIGFRGTREAVV